MTVISGGSNNNAPPASAPLPPLTNKMGPAHSRNWLAVNIEKMPEWWPLSEEEVALILDRSPKQLADDRVAGNPPPSTRDKGSVMYRTGDVRDYLKTLPSFNNTAEASAHKKKRGGYNSFATYLDNAAIDDEWPITIVAGKPVDFFASLELEIAVRRESSCRWMTLGDYLAERKAYAERAPRLAESAQLKIGTKAELPPRKLVLGQDTL